VAPRPAGRPGEQQPRGRGRASRAREVSPATRQPGSASAGRGRARGAVPWLDRPGRPGWSWSWSRSRSRSRSRRRAQRGGGDGGPVPGQHRGAGQHGGTGQHRGTGQHWRGDHQGRADGRDELDAGARVVLVSRSARGAQCPQRARCDGHPEGEFGHVPYGRRGQQAQRPVGQATKSAGDATAGGERNDGQQPDGAAPGGQGQKVHEWSDRVGARAGQPLQRGGGRRSGEQQDDGRSCQQPGGCFAQSLRSLSYVCLRLHSYSAGQCRSRHLA